MPVSLLAGQDKVGFDLGRFLLVEIKYGNRIRASKALAHRGMQRKLVEPGDCFTPTASVAAPQTMTSSWFSIQKIGDPRDQVTPRISIESEEHIVMPFQQVPYLVQWGPATECRHDAQVGEVGGNHAHLLQHRPLVRPGKTVIR